MFTWDATMYDIIWLVLMMGMFAVSIAYLNACERM